uniref:Uncharacterized protein n=1 Tax=Myotis myotis TaxID=51298 RepID=A0A7J7RH26_MYOMY|nr:hypothetical protein mMyoMyo1_010307 [Myotis myotis]
MSPRWKVGPAPQILMLLSVPLPPPCGPGKASGPHRGGCRDRFHTGCGEPCFLSPLSDTQTSPCYQGPSSLSLPSSVGDQGRQDRNNVQRRVRGSGVSLETPHKRMSIGRHRSKSPTPWELTSPGLSPQHTLNLGSCLPVLL